MTITLDRSSKESIEHVRSLLAQRIGQERMELWFQGTERWTLESEAIHITFDNEFLSDCVKSFCAAELKAAAQEGMGIGTRVVVGFDPSLSSPTQSPLQLYKPANHSPSGHSVSGAATGSASGPVSGRPNVAHAGGLRSSESLEESPRTNTSVRLPNRTGQEMGERGPTPRPMTGESVYRGGESNRVSTPWNENRVGMKVDHWSEFIDGDSNRMAKTAAEMVLERPGNLTPLFIHGPCGVGKTHLLRGLAEQLRGRHQMRRVIYLTAEQFTIDFTDSARGSGFASFRKKYRDVDAMLIDDIQFFVGKGATLIELRNTVDNLIRSNRQVVLTGDRSLGELSGMGSELHARIAGGMICSMEPLDEACRVTLLERLCKKNEVEVSRSTLETLVRLTSGDARLQHGLAFRILTAQRSRGRRLEESEIIACCQDLLRASQPIVRMTDIEKAVCDIFGLEPKSLQAKSKVKTISQPRMLAMFLARKYTRAAYSEIGTFFGNRQHSTVISAQKKVEDWLESNLSMDHNRGSISVRDMLRNLEATLQVG